MGKVFLYGMKGGGTPAVLEEKTVALDMAGGDQEVTPSTGYTGLSKAVVTRPATFIAENIKNGVTIGGVLGTFVGTAIPNNLDDLVDGTLASFTMPNGKTKVKQYLFYNDTALTSVNLQGATEIEQYAFYNCANANITLPSTLTKVGTNAFYNCTGGSGMILDCVNPCTIGTTAFLSAKVTKIKGVFTLTGTQAFKGQEVQEIDASFYGAMSNNLTQLSAATKIHATFYGAMGMFATECDNLSDLQLTVTSGVTSFGTNMFSRAGSRRSNPEQNILVFDLRNATAAALLQGSFSGASSAGQKYYFQYTKVLLPSTIVSIATKCFNYVKNSDIYFTGRVPTIQTDMLQYESTDNHIWVPYNYVNEYRTAANWNVSRITSILNGYAPANTFVTGQTLPTVNEEGYGITWYSDTAMTTQVTTVADATQELYCIVGTTILAYRIKSLATMDCSVTITDGTNNYAVNDQVLVGTSLTITSAYNDPTKAQVYMFVINGTNYEPSTSETITVASDITVLCLYYDGINAPVEPVFANNSWQQVLTGCQNGLAGTLWQIGDIKTDSAGFVWKIVDLKNARYARANGTGYTNCAFMMDPRCFDETTAWRTSSDSDNYSRSLVNTKLSTNGVYYNQIDQTLAALVDQNKIIVKASQAISSETADCTVGFFAPCFTEMGYTGSSHYATDKETICNGVTMGAFEYFASNTNSLRIRKDSTNTAQIYWLRSRYDPTYAIIVAANGSSSNGLPRSAFRVCPCFAF